MAKPMVKLSRRKKIYYNNTKNYECACCGEQLKNKFVLSAPNGKYRCLSCALKYNIIVAIPTVIKKAIEEKEEKIIIGQ
jgi:hypothetical protein